MSVSSVFHMVVSVQSHDVFRESFESHRNFEWSGYFSMFPWRSLNKPRFFFPRADAEDNRILIFALIFYTNRFRAGGFNNLSVSPNGVFMPLAPLL